VRNKRRIKRGGEKKDGSEGLGADGVEVELHVSSWYIDDGVVEISCDQHQ